MENYNQKIKDEGYLVNLESKWFQQKTFGITEEEMLKDSKLIKSLEKNK
jgi:hypothetical protein